MAVSLHTASSTPRVDPKTRACHHRLSCGTKLYSGLKLQSSSTFGTGIPNLTAEFYGKVDKNPEPGTHNHIAMRGRVRMSPITPRVPYRTPGEGTWQ